MRLRIITPLSIAVVQDINALRAEDASGSFGVLAGHAPFLTTLTTSIVSWRTGETERFCALRGGVMTVGDASDIDIATREAVTGDDLATLASEVLARFQSDEDSERTEHVDALRLQFNAIRHMVSRLKPSVDSGEFR